MCGYTFFGADHMVFASDYPYPGGAARIDVVLGEGVQSVKLMSIPEAEKEKIFSLNARRILKLS
jgi:predicted TIM-barrel fold metal-dependent hydrolase